MSNRREFLLLAGAAGLAAASPSDAADTPTPRLQAYLANLMRTSRIPGMQVAVVQRGQIVFQTSLGIADVESGSPVTGDTVFQVASCTKAFVGVAVMQLVEAGKLSLDAPLSRYLPGLPAAWNRVTVGHAATHTSGLPDITDNLANLHLLVEGDDQASWIKLQTLPVRFAPGEKFDYCQTNYVALGKIIEAVSGEPFGRFIQKRQFDVAGMPRTVFGDDHDVVPHSARTYTPYRLVDGKPMRTDTLYKTYIEFPGMLRTCGGLNTTAVEMAHWIIALNRGDLFRKPDSLRTLRTARRLNDGKPGSWGIGGWLIDRPAHPLFFAVGISKSAFAIYPQDDVAVVALTNLSAELWTPFTDAIAAFYVQGLA